MNQKELSDAVDRVYNKLSSKTPEEFKQLLNIHKNGDIARILLETGALSVGEIESKAFETSFNYDNISFEDIDVWEDFVNSVDLISGQVYEQFEISNFQDRLSDIVDFNFLDTSDFFINEDIVNEFQNLTEIPTETGSAIHKKLVYRLEEKDLFYLDLNEEFKCAA